MATKKTTNNKNTKQVSSMWSWRVLVPVLVAGFLFFVANSALWVNNVLFNTQVFTATTTEAILSESSRMSIAGDVVDKALADRPVAQRVLSQPATKLVAGLLDTNLAEKALTRTVTRLQTAVTTKNPENIELDLTGIKNVATKLIAVADTAGVEVQEPERELPDKIVLFDASKVPNLYSYGQVFLWLAPLAGITALIMYAYPHLKERKLVKRIMILQGAVLVGFGLLAMTIGPLFRPMILSGVASSNARVVVENVYNAFIATFNSQTMWLFVLGFVLAVFPLTIWTLQRWVMPRLSAKKTK